MALTREFRSTVVELARKDRVFRRGLLIEALEALINGEIEVGKPLLRDLVNATLGFAELSRRTGIPDKSLQRMLGPRGNPTATNLFKLIGVLQRNEKVVLEVRTKRHAA